MITFSKRDDPAWKDHSFGAEPKDPKHHHQQHPARDGSKPAGGKKSA